MTILRILTMDAVVISNSVTRIENQAFKDNTDLKFVTIPGSVTEIGDEAFSGCSNLQDICIPNSVRKIGTAAFDNCKNLRSFVMPLVDLNYAQGTISCLAFRCCEHLESVILPETMDLIDDYAFLGCINLKSFVTYNGGYRLANKQSPNGRIGVNAFMRCESLERVALPDTITVIDACAFACCKSLEAFDFPEHLRYLGWRAFWRCENLKTLELPDSVLLVGEEAFMKCSSLKTIRCSRPNVLSNAKLRKGIQII